MGVNATTVIRYAKHVNVEFNKKTKYPVNEDALTKLSDKLFLTKCINEGKVAKVIATELKVSPSTVLRYARILNIKFPRKPKNLKISEATAISLADKQFFIECKNKKLTFNDISILLGDVSAGIIGYHYRKLFKIRY